MQRITTLPFIALFFLISSCSKFLDAARPDEELSAYNIFSNDSLANAVMINIYADMSKAINYPNGYLSRYMGLYADEIQKFHSNVQDADEPFFKSNVLPTDKTVLNLWSQPYSYIYQCNNVLENLENNNRLSDTMRAKLMGEAYFLRGLHYFYLVNLFGKVPLITNTNASENQTKPREATDKVWQLIIKDLQEAEKLLPVYSPQGDIALLTGIRASKWAARALLARVYLYEKDWQNAVLYASKVIDEGNYQMEKDLKKVFLVNSREVIFQIQPSRSGNNTAEANFFLPVGSAAPLFVLRSGLANSFEADDLRKVNWTGIYTNNNVQYYYPLKWRVRNSAISEEYNVAIRLAELYLIRAEAHAQLGQLYGTKSAFTDISLVRSRAGAQNIPPGLTKQLMLARIEQERKVELFVEWGQRWFDLKRTTAFNNPDKKRAEEVIGSLKTNFSQNYLLLPVPETELIQNVNLGQNTGY